VPKCSLGEVVREHAFHAEIDGDNNSSRPEKYDDDGVEEFSKTRRRHFTEDRVFYGCVCGCCKFWGFLVDEREVPKWKLQVLLGVLSLWKWMKRSYEVESTR